MTYSGAISLVCLVGTEVGGADVAGNVALTLELMLVIGIPRTELLARTDLAVSYIVVSDISSGVLRAGG